MSEHGGAGGGDEDGYNMATGTPTHRDVRNWASAAVHHKTLGAHLVAQLCRYVDQQERYDDEIARFHRLLLDRTGATQIEPVDAIMGRWLDQLAELEQHHREHHNCTECMPCLAHRGPAT